MNLKGFSYYPDFISPHEEDTIISNLLGLHWEEIKMYGVIAKRRVMHFGLNYTYNNRTVTPTVDHPSFIVPFIERSASILKILPNQIVETLVTYYPKGAGIGWHKDAKIFGDKIFGISLNNECVMKFRKKEDNEYEIIKKILKPRSAYILSGEARWQWQHSIPAVKDIRYSITFRMRNSN